MLPVGGGKSDMLLSNVHGVGYAEQPCREFQPSRRVQPIASRGRNAGALSTLLARHAEGTRLSVDIMSGLT